MRTAADRLKPLYGAMLYGANLQEASYWKTQYLQEYHFVGHLQKVHALYNATERSNISLHLQKPCALYERSNPYWCNLKGADMIGS